MDRSSHGSRSERGTVAGLRTVVMAVAATKQGTVLHPQADEREATVVRALLRVPAHRSAANFGVPIARAFHGEKRHSSAMWWEDAAGYHGRGRVSFQARRVVAR